MYRSPQQRITDRRSLRQIFVNNFRARSLGFIRSSHFAVKEFGGRPVRAHPIAPTEQIVNLVRHDQFFECNVLRAQLFDQISGLLEGHVAIVIAVDQQHRGAPVRDVRDRR